MRWWALALWLLASVAGAQGYPRTVVDVAGRSVVLAAEPRRIFLQNGQDIVTIALLDRENPFARLVGWSNPIGDSDPGMWNVMRQRWPAAANVPLLGFDSAGHVDLEALLRMRPDLLVAGISARGAIEGGPVGTILARLRIPILYVDSQAAPIVNAQKTVALLGRALNRDARAQAYLADYQRRLHTLLAATQQERTRPTVFVEIRAGRLGLEQCCYTQGKTAWGLMIEEIGGRNLGSTLLRTPTGDIALETLIRLKPDVVILTGTQQVRRGARGIALGYRGNESEAQAALGALMGRPGFAAIATNPHACVFAMHHQFYNSPFNIVALEYLARALYPHRFAHLAPDATYRELIARHTDIPAVPFLFYLQRNQLGQDQCTAGAVAR
jgi:iron complex transport system substrate-binding protein